MRGNAGDFRGNISSLQYYVEDGQVKSRPITTYVQTNSNRPGGRTTQKDADLAGIKKAEENSYRDAMFELQEQKIKNLQDTYEKRLADVTSQENTRNSLADQIRALTGGDTAASGATAGPAGPQFNQALAQLSAGRNYGSSDLGTMLNFQVSDQQIIDDFNNSKLSRLNSVIDRGNTQIAGIQERLNAANTLLGQLPCWRSTQSERRGAD
jgi:hypothetical protein